MNGRTSEKGVFLIFTAILLPLIFVCIAFAVDLGYAYSGKSKLQNAADASVLACAYQYSNGTAAVKSAANAYMKSNLGSNNYKINSITYGKKDNDENNGVLITLVVSQDQPTFFSKIIGLTKIPVAVKASSLVVPKQDSADTIFKYAMFADYIPNVQLPWPMTYETEKRKSMWSIRFTASDNHIHGPVYTNGSVDMPANLDSEGYRYAYLDNKPGMFTAYNPGYPRTKDNVNNKDIDYFVWNRATPISRSYYDNMKYTEYWDTLLQNSVPDNRWNPTSYSYMHRMAYDNGTKWGKDVVVNDSNSVYTTPLRATLSDTNPLTKEIYKYATDVANDARNTAKYGNVYFDGRNKAGFKVPGGVYNVIIVDGDIHYNAQNYSSTTQHPYVVLISLSGNINITGNFFGEFNALVYAPNGTITYNSPSHFRGSLAGSRIVISNGKQFQQDDFGFGKSGGGDGSVKLYEDNGKVYTTTASI